MRSRRSSLHSLRAATPFDSLSRAPTRTVDPKIGWACGSSLLETLASAWSMPNGRTTPYVGVWPKHTPLSALHASEGFGRIVAESMLPNTLVIATDYSGSQEVCQVETALPVPYTLVELGPDDYPLGAGQ